MARRWVANLVLITLSVAISLGGAEAALQLLDYPPDRGDHQRLFVDYDSIRGWRNIPNARGTYATDEYRVRLRYNSRGLRGEEIPYEAPPDAFRVLVLGDSFVEAYSVDENDRVTEVLCGMLEGRLGGRPVQVIPMGTAGYSTDQELLWLESEGLRYDPDLVVLLFHPNDIWYNTRSRYSRGFKPRFVEASDSLRLTNVPVPRPGSRGSSAEAEEEAHRGLVARGYGWIREHSKVYWLVARTVKRSRRLHAVAVKLGLAPPPPEMLFGSEDLGGVPGEFLVFLREPPPEVDRAWRITSLLLDRMRRRVRSTGAEFVLFHIPIRGAIYDEEWAVRSEFGLDGSGWDARAVGSRLMDVCRRLSMACIEPTDEFVTEARELDRRGERLYYVYDWHWNANGHRLAAEILARAIVDDGAAGRRRP